MKKSDILYVIIILFFGVLVLSIHAYFVKKDLKNNIKYTCGIITYYSNTSKGATIIEYNYIYINKKYRNIESNGYFKDCEKTGWCIGKCFEVEYSSENPNNSRMNFDKPCDCDSLIIQQGVVITADR